MSVRKLIRPDKLIEYLDTEIRAYVEEAGIYRIDSYGWSDAETEDPEYIS